MEKLEAGQSLIRQDACDRRAVQLERRPTRADPADHRAK